MPRTFDVETLKEQVLLSTTFSQVARLRGKVPTGSNITHIKNMCGRYGISTDHMTGQAHKKGGTSYNKKSASERLVLGSPTDIRVSSVYIRRALIEVGVSVECNECGQTEQWQGKTLQLQVDHKDGCYWNNTPTNLQFLCPNCHSIKTLEETQERKRRRSPKAEATGREPVQ